MRFDSARAAGLTEDKADGIEDGYENRFAPHEVAALKLTDHLIGIPTPVDDELRAELARHFSEAQIAEIAMGVGLFHGMSKVLIDLGLEPAGHMPTTVLPTPGSTPP